MNKEISSDDETDLDNLNQLDVTSGDENDVTSTCLENADVEKWRLRCWRKGDVFQKQRMLYTVCLYEVFTMVVSM